MLSTNYTQRLSSVARGLMLAAMDPVVRGLSQQEMIEFPGRAAMWLA